MSEGKFKTPEEEKFDSNLQTLGDLYEQAKLCLHSMTVTDDDETAFLQLYEILKAMRMIAATAMSELYHCQKNKTFKP